MRHAPLMSLAALCVASAAVTGCATTASPRYILLQHEHTWRGPAQYDDAVAALPSRQMANVIHGGGQTPALVGAGTTRHRVAVCRLVDLEHGIWSEVHCGDDLDSPTTQGGQIGRKRHWDVGGSRENSTHQSATPRPCLGPEPSR